MRFLFVFLLGLTLGALALYYYEHGPEHSREALGANASDLSGSARDAAGKAAAKTRAAGSEVSEGFSRKLRDWHLTSEDIHADLAKGGEIARQNAARAREEISDVRIVAMIKAKYVLDRDLSAKSITVESHEGDVTLTGTVGSESLIGKAVGLALDTDGVRHVKAKLTATPEK